MNLNSKEAIDEIINRVNERYLLKKRGLALFSDNFHKNLYADTELDALLISNDVASFRERVLSRVGQYLFQSYFSKSDVSYQDFMYEIFKQVLQRMKDRLKEPDSIDVEMKILPRTVAYKPSYQIFNERIFPQAIMTELYSPYEMEKVISQFSNDNYPVNIDILFNRLKNNDDDFWEELSYVLYKIAGGVTLYVTKNYNLDNEFIEDVKGEIYVSGVEKVRELLVEKQGFETGKHLFNFMKRVCLNIALNLKKGFYKHSFSRISLDDLPDLADELENDNSRDYVSDLRNELEVKNALVGILYLEEGHVYEFLVRGIEDKVNILFLLVKEGFSYEAIVHKISGNSLSSKKQKKEEERYRKQVERVKKTLYERFVQYLKVHS